MSYIPTTAISVENLSTSPLRVAIQGVPGSGKTFAALTFPNPIVLDIDNKLGGYRRANPQHVFPVVPLWNRDYVEGTLKVVNRNDPKKEHPHNVRDALKSWLQIEGPKLHPEQTLVLDSVTTANDGFDTQTNLPWEKIYNRNGEEDGFAFWKRKLQYNSELATLLRSLPCMAVAIFHEQYERDENNRIVGIKPLIQGQSADKMPGYFTDFYRQRVVTKDNTDLWGKEIQPRNGETEIYVWQTCKDKFFQIACKSMPSIPNFVRANYNEAFGTK